MKKFILTLALIASTTQISQAKTEAEIHMNAATALSFIDNNTSYSNLKSINQHLSQAGIKTDQKINSAKRFSQLDNHEQAAIALSFTHNNTSPTMASMIKTHQKKSANAINNEVKSVNSEMKVAKLFKDMNKHEKAMTMLTFNKNSSSAPVQKQILSHLNKIN